MCRLCRHTKIPKPLRRTKRKSRRLAGLRDGNESRAFFPRPLAAPLFLSRANRCFFAEAAKLTTPSAGYLSLRVFVGGESSVSLLLSFFFSWKREEEEEEGEGGGLSSKVSRLGRSLRRRFKESGKLARSPRRSFFHSFAISPFAGKSLQVLPLASSTGKSDGFELFSKSLRTPRTERTTLGGGSLGS